MSRNGWWALAVFGMILTSAAAGILLEDLGEDLYLRGACASMVLFLLLHFRWRIDTAAVALGALLWPASLLCLPFIAWRQERLRRMRVVREVLGE